MKPRVLTRPRILACKQQGNSKIMVAIRILRPRNGSFLEAFGSLFVTSSRRKSRAQIVKNFSPRQACFYCPFKDVHGLVCPTLPNQSGR